MTIQKVFGFLITLAVALFPPPVFSREGEVITEPARWARHNFVPGPEFYDDAVDCEVTYDSVVAQRYDDGYDGHAAESFDAALAPYGRWFNHALLGRVWVPHREIVGDEFAPYATGGRWSLTEYGWTWLSDWDWGWAVFHYGRWMFLPDAGWSWIPGTLWGPAWVAWRRGRNYVAWAPLPPRGIDVPRLFSEGAPWHFARARSDDFPALKLTPRMALAIFERLVARARDRTLEQDGIFVVSNAGPVAVLAMNGKPRIPMQLVNVAPNAMPRPSVVARPGTAVKQRPWREQLNRPSANLASGSQNQ